MIDGTLHILGTGEGSLEVTFASIRGTGLPAVSGAEQARHFITQTLGCFLTAADWTVLAGPPPNGIPVRVEEHKYLKYFSNSRSQRGHGAGGNLNQST
jgi:hypothetical protein